MESFWRDRVVEICHAHSSICVFSLYFIKTTHFLSLNYWADLLRALVLLLISLTFSLFTQRKFAKMLGIPLDKTINCTQLGLTSVSPLSDFGVSSFVFAETFEFSFGVVFVLIKRELMIFCMVWWVLAGYCSLIFLRVGYFCRDWMVEYFLEYCSW